MNTPARYIRAIVEQLPGGQHSLTVPQQERHTLILAAARAAMARYGRTAIVMSEFSVGLRLTPLQIRWHFPDLDNLFGAVLRDHLNGIAAAIRKEVPTANDPDPYTAARAAYFAATRDANGAFTETHALFLRERYLLPEDEALSVDAHEAMLAPCLDGEHGAAALDLLNNENLTLADIEAAMARLPAAAPAAQRAPAMAEAAPVPRPATQAPQLPRHLRRKIEALRRQRQRHEEN
jgi:AcrR family transcriptional regulator